MILCILFKIYHTDAYQILKRPRDYAGKSLPGWVLCDRSTRVFGTRRGLRMDGLIQLSSVVISLIG